MSEGFTSSETFDPEGQQPRRSRGKGLGCIGWTLVGCGGILFVFVVVVALFVWSLPSMFTQDPEEADKILQEIIPSEVPPGYAPHTAMHIPFVNLQLVVIAPENAPLEDPELVEEGHTVLIVVRLPGASNQQLQAQLQQQGIEVDKNAKLIQNAPITIEAGERQFSGQRMLWEQQGGKKVLQYFFGLKTGVSLSAVGPDGEFDEKAMKAFLTSVGQRGGGEPIEAKTDDEVPAKDEVNKAAPKKEPVPVP